MVRDCNTTVVRPNSFGQIVSLLCKHSRPMPYIAAHVGHLGNEKADELAKL